MHFQHDPDKYVSIRQGKMLDRKTSQGRQREDNARSLQGPSLLGSDVGLHST